MLPFPDIIRALSSQHLPAIPTCTSHATREEILVLPPHLFSHPVVRGCGWFAAVSSSSLNSTVDKSGEQITTYFTKAVMANKVSNLQIPSPFEFASGIAWVNVEKMKHVFRCEITGRVWEVQLWADPALLGSQVIVGSEVSDGRGGRFLTTGDADLRRVLRRERRKFGGFDEIGRE